MNKVRKRKILFGAVDIGFRIEHYSKFIKNHPDLNLIPESLSIYLLPASHYQTEYTYSYQFQERSSIYRWTHALINFLRSAFRYDIFHFFSGETLLPRKLRSFELRVYRLMGKRIIMHFVGSDIRSPKYITGYAGNTAGNKEHPISEPWQIKLIRDAKRYANTILVSTPDLKRIIPEAIFYPVVLDLNKFKIELEKAPAREFEKGKIRILHSPSNAEIKGSRYIDSALEKLKTKYGDAIEIVRPVYSKNENTGSRYSTSRYELFSLYKSSHIVIDQMLIGWYGLQTVEALAAGTEVICYIDEELKKDLYPGCPIHIANTANLDEILEETFLRVRNGNPRSSYDWIENYHTIENNNKALLDAWNV